MEALTIAALSAKLIGIGVAAWKANEKAGWSSEEATAFEKVLAALPGFAEAFGSKNPNGEPLAKYCELVTVAFGDAWRRHWHGHEQLAPKQLEPRWWDWLGDGVTGKRIRQVHARLEQGKVADVSLGDGAPASELQLLTLLDEPLRSPWYVALWRAFLDGSLEADDGMPPLLLLEQGGESRARFEHHFRLAFNEGLASSRGQPLVQWLDETRGKTREDLVRRLLAGSLSRLRREHIFGTHTADMPYLPLEDIYVEPMVQPLELGGFVKGWEPARAIEAIEHLLADQKTRIVLVLADFGRGKSLTARTLAYRAAERFLNNVAEPTPNQLFPVYVRSQTHLRTTSLTTRDAVRAAQRERLRDILPLDKTDPELDLPRHQRALLLIDGLDEVQLHPSATRELFTDLLDHESPQCRIVVFSRPAAVPEEVRRLDGVTTLRVNDFDAEREEWLYRWSKVTNILGPTVASLRDRGLYDVCSVPVLLFMAAQTWASLGRDSQGAIDVYDAFVSLMARSKLQHDQQHHPEVHRGAEVLARALAALGHISPSAEPVEALVEFQSRLAWRAQSGGRDDSPALTVRDVAEELNRLNVGEQIGLVERGVLLSLSTNLSDGATEVHFGHESFREFLVAKYWHSRLLRISAARRSGVTAIERELYGGRLLARRQLVSATFLLGLLRRGDISAIANWAEDAFDDETLSAASLREDERYALREAALFLASNLHASGITLKHRYSIATLAASFLVRNDDLFVVAPGLKHPGAILQSAILKHADIHEANFSGADLTNTNLIGANLTSASLIGASLIGASLIGACLIDANLTEADLTSATLVHAALFDANLTSATLTSATLRHANLHGANLRHAILVGANLTNATLTEADLTEADLTGADCKVADFTSADLTDADLTGAALSLARFSPLTRFPAGFDPVAAGMVLVDEPASPDDPSGVKPDKEP